MSTAAQQPQPESPETASGDLHHGPKVAEPLSIGEVLAVLSEEFPDITISKIRFLEAQGLLQPERNASGYRQFGDADIERLRWILRQQRDHFLPLKVIRRALERGVDVIDAGGGDQPTLWSAVAEAAALEEIGSERERIARGEADEARRNAARTRAHPSTRDRRRAPGAGSVRERAAAGDRPRYSSPADVVAALQEDPRPEKAAVAEGPGSAGKAEGTETPDGADEPSATPPGDGASEPAAEVADNRSGVVETGVKPGGSSTEDEPGGALDEGGAPPGTPDGSREEGSSASRGAPGAVEHGGRMRQLNRDELLSEVSLSERLLDELLEFGLLDPQEVAGELLFDQVDLNVAELARRCGDLGLSPRHLRMYKIAADREAGLLEQVAMPLLKQRNPAARSKASETVSELATMGAELHKALLARELGPHLAP